MVSRNQQNIHCGPCCIKVSCEGCFHLTEVVKSMLGTEDKFGAFMSLGRNSEEGLKKSELLLEIGQEDTVRFWVWICLI